MSTPRLRGLQFLNTCGIIIINQPIKTIICEFVMSKQKQHYVNNKDFYNALVDYLEQIKQCENEGKPRPQVPNYIGECFLKIAVNLSHKANFAGYTFREDMVSDGIENSLLYIDRFNPEKSSNPFAYFTQIIYYAFLRRIQKEKKQIDLKSKLLEKSNFDEVFTSDGYTSTSDLNSIKQSLEIKNRKN